MGVRHSTVMEGTSLREVNSTGLIRQDLLTQFLKIAQKITLKTKALWVALSQIKI
jgi:hypothetical protein